MNIRAKRRKADMFAVKNKTDATPEFAKYINVEIWEGVSYERAS